MYLNIKLLKSFPTAFVILGLFLEQSDHTVTVAIQFLAQWLERWTTKPEVKGLNPPLAWGFLWCNLHLFLAKPV